VTIAGMSLRTLFLSSGVSLPAIQPKVVNAGGIAVEIWGMEQLGKSSSSEVVVMFFLHGRTRDKETMHGMAGAYDDMADVGLTAEEQRQPCIFLDN
jgi:hypothetical protein